MNKKFISILLAALIAAVLSGCSPTGNVTNSPTVSPSAVVSPKPSTVASPSQSATPSVKPS